MEPLGRLLIAGAGGFGREVLGWALDVEDTGPAWRVAGFLDDNPQALAGMETARPLLGAIRSYEPRDGDQVVCAIGDPARRLEIAEQLVGRGAALATLVHPTAVLARDASLGKGCIVCPGAVVTSNARIGAFVTLNVSSSVGHDAVVGNGCTLSGHADVTGGASLGRGVFLGSHAVVLPGAQVGDRAVVGAGSVVLRRVPPGVTVFGVPAREVATSGAATEAFE